jgi:hypothetical protein
MTWAMVAVAAASAVASARAAYVQTSVARDTAKYNAQLAETQAQDARTRGAEEASRIRRQNDQLIGAQRAAFSAKGLDISDGSVGDALDQTDFFSQVDQSTARQNAAKEAWNLRARKAGYEYEARNARPGMAAATSLLSSASSVASKWKT